ncbi:hypothetical protein GHT09_000568 [Marmota monax]|uniref:Uncharacterized protein n=1 Tax=Marmota monax TaxID=9995 RepID=A0A834PWF1_MARMO|nr:hypothetical protein GHT09_000568 [Marmota monax]
MWLAPAPFASMERFLSLLPHYMSCPDPESQSVCRFPMDRGPNSSDKLKKNFQSSFRFTGELCKAVLYLLPSPSHSLPISACAGGEKPLDLLLLPFLLPDPPESSSSLCPLDFPTPSTAYPCYCFISERSDIFCVLCS